MLEDSLVVVDEEDRVIGQGEKLALHTINVQLHRAFSVFVFNSRNEVLLQQRSAKKLLWPLYWSNSYCSHPRLGESMLDAVKRRSGEEISLAVDPSFQYKFIYRARYEQVGEEFELCYVYTTHSDEVPMANGDEVSQLRFVPVDDMDEFLAANSCTPWFIQEWRQLSESTPWLGSR
jgi:isopentenyl-diphosphate delta-isomerase